MYGNIVEPEVKMNLLFFFLQVLMEMSNKYVGSNTTPSVVHCEPHHNLWQLSNMYAQYR